MGFPGERSFTPRISFDPSTHLGITEVGEDEVYAAFGEKRSSAAPEYRCMRSTRTRASQGELFEWGEGLFVVVNTENRSFWFHLTFLPARNPPRKNWKNCW